MSVVKETVKEITLEDIKEVQKVLKKLSKDWAVRLAKKMYPNVPEETAKDKIYNLINGNTERDQESRTIFIFHANELIAEIQGKVDLAINSIEEIKKIA